MLPIKKKLIGMPKIPLIAFSIFFSIGLTLSLIEETTFFRNLHLIGIIVCLGHWILLQRARVKD